MKSSQKNFFALSSPGRGWAGFCRLRAVCSFAICLGVGFFTPAGLAQTSADLSNVLTVEFVKPPISQVAENTFLFAAVNRDPALVRRVGFAVRSTTQTWEYAGDYVKELGLYKFYWDLTNFHNTSYGISAHVEMSDGTKAQTEIFLAVVRPDGTTDGLAGGDGVVSDDNGSSDGTSASGGASGPSATDATTPISTSPNYPPAPTPQIEIVEPGDFAQVQTSVRLVAKGTVPFDAVTFIIDNPVTSLSPDLILPGSVIGSENRSWEGTFTATTVTPGNYVVRVRGQYTGTTITSVNSVKIVVILPGETIGSPLAIKFVNAPPSPLSSSKYFFVQSNIPFAGIASLTFQVKGDNIVRVYSGTPLSAIGAYQFYWDLNDFSDGGYAITAIAEGVDGQRATTELYLAVVRTAGNSLSPPTSTPEFFVPRTDVAVLVENQTAPKPPSPTTRTGRSVPSAFPPKSALPPPVATTTSAQDMPILRSGAATEQNTTKPILPPEGADAVASVNALPKLCVDADLRNESGCQRYVFLQTFTESVSTSPEKFFDLPDCQSAGGKLEICLRIIRQKYFPKDCLRQNVQDAGVCYRYLQALQAPAVCTGLDRVHCEELLREKIVAPACQQVGALDPAVCSSYLEQHIINQVSCTTGVSDCPARAKDNLLTVVFENQRLGEIQQVVATKFDNPVVLQPGNQKPIVTGTAITAVEQAVPVVVAVPISVQFIPSSSGVVVRDDNSVAAMAPAVLVIDMDGDGLPDDVEQRLGTDPARPDTDGDGFSDRQEVATGYNPLGGGAVTVSPAPVEQALAARKILEQPLSVQQASSGLVVAGLHNVPVAADPSGATSAVQITGRGIPGEVVTLFIYSSLPLVVTTRVNEDGNWTYTLQQSLVDGPHEVYVAVNDATGKVVARSSPFTFLVREAKAASPAELFTPTPLSSPVFNWGRVYLPLSIAVILIGVMLFLIVYNLTRRHS